MNKVKLTSALLLIIYSIISCTSQPNKSFHLNYDAIVILGTAQDAGSPHMNCRKNCCINLWNDANKKTNVVSLALYDKELNESWLFEATPDIALQLNKLKELNKDDNHLPSGVFLTHAHIGHYTGLQFFGKEAMGAKEMNVFAMPKLKNYLEQNGPWSQLVEKKNIALSLLYADSMHTISKNLKVKPVLVPHRDEYSETVGFYIHFKEKNILFIPDIDKWEKWDKNIAEEIKHVDYTFIDATFYDNNELPNRDMAEIPHPFVVESMELFKALPDTEKKKIHFIHFNHSNPLLKLNSKEHKIVLEAGFNVSHQYQIVSLK